MYCVLRNSRCVIISGAPWKDIGFAGDWRLQDDIRVSTIIKAVHQQVLARVPLKLTLAIPFRTLGDRII